MINFKTWMAAIAATLLQLRDAGVLRGAHAEIDGRALGVELEALVAVQLRRHARAEVEAFRRHALALPEVVAMLVAITR